jgi:hypothetical protein
MILPLVQFAVILAVGLYLAKWGRSARRRNSQSWDALLAQLRPEWSARTLSDHFLWREGINGNSEETWNRLEGPRGLWVIFQNARVMMQMADFADRNGEGVDKMLLETLRSDAIQIRLLVLMALAQYAFTQASEGVRVNAYRAAGQYTAMAARLTELLQQYAANVIPDYVAAM